MRAFVLVLVFGLVPASATADALPDHVVERVVAVVDGEPVFLSELRAFVSPWIDDGVDPSTLESLYRAGLTRLVERRLIARAVARAGLEPTDADLDRAIQSIPRAPVALEWRTASELDADAAHHARFRQEVRLLLRMGRLLQAHGHRDIDCLLRRLRRDADVELRL